MKESTIASGRTESDRAKKRYANPASNIFCKADKFDRLQTRIAYVQQSEEALAEKRTHCANYSALSIVVLADIVCRQGSRRGLSKCYGSTWRRMNLCFGHF